MNPLNEFLDGFFLKTKCDRCHASLDETGLDIRTMSWFTHECICSKCKKEEEDLRAKLPNDVDYEGCGYLPVID